MKPYLCESDINNHVYIMPVFLIADLHIRKGDGFDLGALLVPSRFPIFPGAATVTMVNLPCSHDTTSL